MIKLNNIGKNYGDQLIFKDVELTAKPGDFIGIVGKTGCGKSTLINIISGYEKYDFGSNVINGKELKDYSSREVNYFRNRRIAFLFQSFNLINDLSVYENLKLSLNLSVFKSKLIDEYLEKLGLLEYKHKKIKNLSGGQKQRIALLRAIIKDFDILICDEPTGNLDDTNSELILDLIKDLCKDKIVIMVTHKKSIANLYFNKIYEYNYYNSTFDLIKDYRNDNEVSYKKSKKVYISKIGIIVHSLKRLLMLKGFNIALLLFISFFMLSYSNSKILSESKYEDLLLEHELEYNALQELKGYSEFKVDYDQLEESEYIDFIATNSEFYGPIKLYETDYIYRLSPVLGPLKAIFIENGEEWSRVIDASMAGGYYIEPQFDKITLTTLDKDTFPHKELLVGRMPENEYEVIIDVVTLIKLLEDYDFTYSEYINGNDTVEDIYRIMETKHIQFYKTNWYYLNEETNQFEQVIESIKLKIVGFLDSKHLSSEISGLYVYESTLENISNFFYAPDISDVIIYKADPTEETHDKVMNEIDEIFTLDRARIDNIDSSYINVRTMVSFNYFLAILSLVFFFIGFITLIVYTFSHYKRDIALYRSLGYSNFYIILILSLNNIVLTVFSYYLALTVNNNFVTNLLGYNTELLTLSNNQVTNGLIISVLMILLINLIYVLRYRKKPINSII